MPVRLWLSVSFSADGSVEAASVSGSAALGSLAEMAIAGECGFDVSIGGALECFSESASRVVCAVDPVLVDELLSRAATAGVRAADVGEAGGDRLVATGAFDVALADATRTWRDAIPHALGADVGAR